jgi:hypothetical protein
LAGRTAASDDAFAGDNKADIVARAALRRRELALVIGSVAMFGCNLLSLLFWRHGEFRILAVAFIAAKSIERAGSRRPNKTELG